MINSLMEQQFIPYKGTRNEHQIKSTFPWWRPGKGYTVINYHVRIDRIDRKKLSRIKSKKAFYYKADS